MTLSDEIKFNNFLEQQESQGDSSWEEQDSLEL